MEMVSCMMQPMWSDSVPSSDSSPPFWLGCGSLSHSISSEPCPTHHCTACCLHEGSPAAPVVPTSKDIGGTLCFSTRSQVLVATSKLSG